MVKCRGELFCFKYMFIRILETENFTVWDGHWPESVFTRIQNVIYNYREGSFPEFPRPISTSILLLTCKHFQHIVYIILKVYSCSYKRKFGIFRLGGLKHFQFRYTASFRRLPTLARCIRFLAITVCLCLRSSHTSSESGYFVTYATAITKVRGKHNLSLFLITMIPV